MAQIPGLRSRIRATHIVVESTFGVYPTSPTRMFPIEDYTFKVMQDNHVIADERGISQDSVTRALGFRSASAEFSFYVKANATPIDSAAATPVEGWQDFLWHWIMGGQNISVGGTVASGSTSSIVLGASEALNFLAGRIGACTTSGGTDREAFMSSLESAGTTITPWPTLASAPTAAGACLGSYQYYLSETNSNSFSMQVGFVDDATTRYTLTGGIIPNLEIEYTTGGLIKVKCSCTFADWTGPTDSTNPAVVTTYATDSVYTIPFVMSNAKVYLQSPSTLTRVHYAIDSVRIKPNGPWQEYITELGGGINGKLGVRRALQRPAFTLEVDTISDTAIDTIYFAQTQLTYMQIITYGATNAKRFDVLMMPSARLISAVERKNRQGKFLGQTLVLEPQLNAITNSTATEQAYATLHHATI